MAVHQLEVAVREKMKTLRAQGYSDPQELNEARKRANLGSAFDLRDLGESLNAVESTNF